MATIISEDFEEGLDSWSLSGSPPEGYKDIRIPPIDPNASVIRYRDVHPMPPMSSWIRLATTEQYYLLSWQFVEGDVFAQTFAHPTPRIEITRADGTVRTIEAIPSEPPKCAC